MNVSRLPIGNAPVHKIDWKGLTFTAVDGDATVLYTPSTVSTAEYSFNGRTWFPADNVSVIIPSGKSVGFRGVISGSLVEANYAHFNMTGKVAASGSIMSMQNGDPEDKTINYDYEFTGLFYECTSLTTAPELPATSLADYCYGAMFSYCTSLVNAPELPATTLADGCYSAMFGYCTSLVNAPELPATSLADYCYGAMFSYCTSLVSAPELPATSLADYCYSAMFGYCTSLVNAPELPATSLADYCYGAMFYGCTSLVNAPELPATTLADGCYSGMFESCTSLVNAPELPATSLVDRCYRYMFYKCTSLVTAPELPATELAYGCYSYMFSNCKNLNYIKAMFTTTPSLTYTTYWVDEVAATGTFVKNKDATWDVTGVNGVPDGWTIENVEPDQLQQQML